jgi:cytochrome c biogenesis protein
MERHPMKSLIQFFSSVKLAIVLIIIITAASILGTFIPQNRGIEEYTVQYGQLANLLIRLQFTRLYQSFWYKTFLLLFSLNILVCTLTRLSPKLKKAFKPKIETEAKNLAALKIKEKLKKNWDITKAKEEIKKSLVSRNYRLREGQEKDKAYLLARKKTTGLFGADVVHFGLLVILAGGLISGSGISDYLSLYEGQTLSVPKADFQIRLDQFKTELYDNGSVRDWKSTLTVIENGQERQTKVVEVNHPLSYKGYLFYQSSYGWDWKNPTLEMWAKKKDDPDYVSKVRLRLGERVELDGENLQIAALQFVPDFIIDENKRVATRSMQPNNPAVYIEGWQEDTQVFSGWIFAKYPEFSRMHSDEETNLSFELKDYQGGEISVIQAAKDPGANFIWVGCGFLMLGLALAFYWPPREIKVVIKQTKNNTEITAGGIVSKNREAFRAEFENIMTLLRRQK